MSYDRKAFSAEPQTAAAIMGKRWEDLIDAAASATEEDSRDLTPVSASVLSTATHMLTSTGSTISATVAAHQQSDLASTLRCFAFPVLHGFTIAAQLDSSTTRHVGPTAISFRRVLH
jgi:glycerol dehydrogenase-like iron-containing ADH family enzyme